MSRFCRFGHLRKDHLLRFKRRVEDVDELGLVTLLVAGGEEAHTPRPTVGSGPPQHSRRNRTWETSEFNASTVFPRGSLPGRGTSPTLPGGL